MKAFLVTLYLLITTLPISESVHLTDQPANFPDLTNVTEPKPMKDLFNNLGNSTTQANFIRSLPYSPEVPATCGEFTFSLAGLDEAVHILQAELHLWLTVHSSPQQEAYIVGIQSVHADGRVSRVTMRHIEVRSADSDGYVKFEVDQLLRDAVREGASFIPFRVIIYDRIIGFLESNNCTCGCVQDVLFPHEGFTNNTIPTLIAFTHVPRAGRIDFRTLASRLALERDQQLQIDETAVNNKRKRSDQITCSIRPLFIEPTNLIILRAIEQIVGHDNFEITYPLKPFDVTTCGGRCHTRIPILYNIYLYNRKVMWRPIRDFTSLRCNPVWYRSYSVKVYIPPSVAVVTIEDLLINACACLDFTNHHS